MPEAQFRVPFWRNRWPEREIPAPIPEFFYGADPMVREAPRMMRWPKGSNGGIPPLLPEEVLPLEHYEGNLRRRANPRSWFRRRFAPVGQGGSDAASKAVARWSQ